MPAKARPTRTPQHFTVRDNVPPGAEVVLNPRAIQEFVRLFGEQVLRRMEQERGRAPG
jgi:hypothetical protein